MWFKIPVYFHQHWHIIYMSQYHTDNTNRITQIYSFTIHIIINTYAYIISSMPKYPPIIINRSCTSTQENILDYTLYVWWEKHNIICYDHISNTKVKKGKHYSLIFFRNVPVSFYLIWFTMKWPIKNNCITLLIKQKTDSGEHFIGS